MSAVHPLLDCSRMFRSVRPSSISASATCSFWKIVARMSAVVAPLSATAFTPAGLGAVASASDVGHAWLDRCSLRSLRWLAVRAGVFTGDEGIEGEPRCLFGEMLRPVRSVRPVASVLTSISTSVSMRPLLC